MKTFLTLLLASQLSLGAFFLNSDKEHINSYEQSIFAPCSVEIKGTFGGDEVDITVTIDVSAIECKLFKDGVKKALEENK
ncbi:hypothetical protein [Winogradskyella immobilis]|uniref:Uncharacterized protein n=1 Tax=Winogradskyella immobilis TaxID=2816852 RepID=A0ABS8EMI1_9FLAO|nr:hypothetical protein [Winogradskyella immobilis]MCC1484424.1 hypothetical protein [Winogradskyella immobilis]MCG0016516.1 hypothetical protein [Winogradskyella immobilis]